MIFQDIMKKPMPERELLQRICLEFQKFFHANKESFYFIKLELVDEPKRIAQIAWVKSFPTLEALWAFEWDTKFERARVMTKFNGDHYKLHSRSFFMFDSYKVYEDKINPWGETISSTNCELDEMLPYELVMGAFGEITELFEKSKGPKTA